MRVARPLQSRTKLRIAERCRSAQSRAMVRTLCIILMADVTKRLSVAWPYKAERGDAQQSAALHRKLHAGLKGHNEHRRGRSSDAMHDGAQLHKAMPGVA